MAANRRSPASFTSAPPLLPLLIDASVWMRLRNDAPPASFASRPSAETTPTVIVSPSPRGLPTAIAGLPDYTGLVGGLG